MYLLLVDTTGIQPYIFGSNRLQENIGASFLVDLATGKWAVDVYKEIYGQTEPLRKPLYEGGGNFTALFDDITQANEFERKLTRKVLTDAPGLQLLVVCVPRRTGKLSDDLNAAFQKMARVKMERTRSSGTLGLGVTRSCASTALPAAYSLKINDAQLSVSPEIFAKVHGFNTSQQGSGKLEQIRDLAYRRLIDVLEWQRKDYRFPRDFEEMGRSKNEQSYLAVVHADGNGMGERIKAIGKNETTPEQYARAIRDFSEGVKLAAQRALRKTVDELMAAIAYENTPPRVEHSSLEMTVPLVWSTKEDAWMLPFRPIVFGGDDVTFVCDGRLGIALAVAFLKHFEAETANLPDGGGRATACAGVAIVKSHYPFARAYHLADELCKKAKEYRKDIRKKDENWDGACLDWHFALGGLAGGLDEIRKREFRVQDEGNLTQRPVALKPLPSSSVIGRTWDFVAEQVKILQGDKWATKRNKMKTLREVLRGGPKEVEKFKTLFQQDLSELLPSNAPEGWAGGRCVLFDAIELSDIYMPLIPRTVGKPIERQERPK